MSKKYLNLILVLLAIGTLSACRTNAPASQGNCNIQALLFDPKQFNLPQEGIEDFHIYSPAPEAPPESAGYSFYYSKDSSSDLIQNWVFRYRFTKQATDMYKARERYDSRTDIFQIYEDFKDWKMPDGSLLKPYADQYHAACDVSIVQDECVYIARYEKYFVFFQVGMSTKSLTIDDFVDGVKKIDSQMVACITSK